MSSLNGNFQVFDNLEDAVANLLFRVVIHDRESRLFLHLVGELILRDISRENLIGHESAVDQQDRPENRFDRAPAMLRAQRSQTVL